MKSNKSLFRDEQFLLDPKRRQEFHDDMDLELLTMYHMKSKETSLYKFYDGNALYRDVIDTPYDYHELCSIFNVCEPDEFLPEILERHGYAGERVIRDRSNFCFELGFNSDGSLHVAPNRMDVEYTRCMDEEDEKLYPNRPYMEQLQKILSIKSFSSLAMKFLESVNLVPGTGQYIVVSASLASHSQGISHSLPVHKDSGNAYIATTLIKEIGLEGAESGVYINEEDNRPDLLLDEERKMSTFGTPKVVGKIDSFELKNPLDMLVINNLEAFHDVSNFSCKARQICIFSLKSTIINDIDYVPASHMRYRNVRI